jgi:excisionase family DNA binding protein
MKSAKVFTPGQIAKICSVAPRTVSKWFDSGRLKGYRIPGRQERRIPREQLIRFLKEHGMPLWELEEEQWHKILLIGTEKLFNDRIKELLPEDQDFKFELADSGFQAGVLAIRFHPDTIIIDFGLGRAESIQIVSNLRKDEAFATTLIIGVVSEDEAAPEQLTQYGFNVVFKKPFDIALLSEKIKGVKGTTNV